LVGVCLINKRFKEVESNTLKIGGGKEDFFGIFGKLSFTYLEIDLTLEYESSELIGTTATKYIWLLNTLIPLLWLRVRSPS